MTIDDDIDDELDMDEADIRADVLRRARSEGALAAYESALEIAQDRKAPAVARASSQRTLLALAGLMDKSERQAATDKPASQMTPDELNETLALIARNQKALAERLAIPRKSTRQRKASRKDVEALGVSGGNVFD